MRVYTKIVMDWSEELQQYVTVDSESFEYEGPVALCKGDDVAKQQEQQQADFNNQLMSIFSQQFSQQSGILKYLQSTLQPMISNPTGFSDDALAAMRTSASDSTASQYQNAQKALQNQQRVNGSADLPSGVNDMADATLASNAATTESQAQNNITLENEQQKQQNYWNAINGLSGVASQVNPLGYSSAATSGSGAVAGLSSAVTASNQSQLLGALGGVVGGAASGVLGGSGTLSKRLFG